MIAMLIAAAMVVPEVKSPYGRVRYLDDPIIAHQGKGVKWACDGPKFDSSCSQSAGLRCDYWPAQRRGKPHQIPTSYADNGRIAYCKWPTN